MQTISDLLEPQAKQPTCAYQDMTKIVKFSRKQSYLLVRYVFGLRHVYVLYRRGEGWLGLVTTNIYIESQVCSAVSGGHEGVQPWQKASHAMPVELLLHKMSM